MTPGTCVNGFDPIDTGHFEVELAMNEPPSEYEYFVHVEFRDGAWFEGTSHN